MVRKVLLFEAIRDVIVRHVGMRLSTAHEAPPHAGAGLYEVWLPQHALNLNPVGRGAAAALAGHTHRVA